MRCLLLACASLFPLATGPQDAASWIRKLNGSETERAEASRKLQELGEPAIGALTGAIESADIELRRCLTDLIGRIRWADTMTPRLEAAADAVFAKLGDPDPATRVLAVRELTELVRNKTVRDQGAFAALLRDPSYVVAREAARQNHGKVADRMRLDGLLAMLSRATPTDADDEYFKFFDRAMRVLKPSDRPRLTPWLKSSEAFGRLGAQAMAYSLGDGALSADLLAALKMGDAQCRIALRGLSIAPPRDATATFKAIVANATAADDIRARAAMALAGLGSPADPDAVMGWCLSKSDTAAIPAIRTIGLMANEKAAIAALGADQGYSDERWTALLEMVARVDHPSVYEALSACSEAGTSWPRAMSNIPSDARIRILTALYPTYSNLDERGSKARRIGAALGMAPPGELNDLAMAILSDPKSTTDHQHFALMLLQPVTASQRAMQRSKLIQFARTDLPKFYWMMRYVGVALPEVADIARERLTKGLDAESVEALRDWGNASDIPLLRTKLEAADTKTAGVIVAALARLGDTTMTDRLIAGMKAQETAQISATTLTDLWSKDLAAVLAKHLGEEAFQSGRTWILWLFHTHRDRSLVPAYRVLLQDKEWRVRQDAAQMAGEWRDAGAKDALRALLKDPESRVSATAMRSLALLGDATVEPMALAMLAAEEGYETSLAIQALAALGTPASIRALRRLSLAGDSYISGEAIDALVSVGSAEALSAARAAVDAGNPSEQALSALQRLGTAEDADLVRPLAIRGARNALATMDAICHRARYVAVKPVHDWDERGPLEEIAKHLAEAYGVPVTLSAELRQGAATLRRVGLWGVQDLYGAIRQLCAWYTNVAPIFDGRELRLVTVEEAARTWAVKTAEK